MYESVVAWLLTRSTQDLAPSLFRRCLWCGPSIFFMHNTIEVLDFISFHKTLRGSNYLVT